MLSVHLDLFLTSCFKFIPREPKCEASQVAQCKESSYQCRRCRRRKRHGFDPWVRKIPWSRKWQPTPVFLSGIFHKQRSLAGYSPWGHKESDMTDQLSTHLDLTVRNQNTKNTKKIMGEKYFQMAFTYMQRCSNSSIMKQRQMKLFQEVRT